MKEYFSKLLTEQERAGSRNPSRKWGRKIKVEDDPDSEYENEIVGKVSSSRRRQYGYNHKEFTDVLAPLYGYLEKNIGRHWDDVYSELCNSLDRRSVTGLHVFTHLWQYVDRNTYMGVDGKVYARSRYGTVSEPDDFYVHPYTGILCGANERRWTYRAYRKRKKNVDVDSIDIWKTADGLKGESYQRIEGIWYQVYWVMEDRYAGYNGRWMSLGHSPWIIKQAVEILKKRQLGKKELKHLGLKNIIQ